MERLARDLLNEIVSEITKKAQKDLSQKELAKQIHKLVDAAKHASVQEILNNPKVKKLIANPRVQEFLKHEKVQEFINNPKVKEARDKITQRARAVKSKVTKTRKAASSKKAKTTSGAGASDSAE